MRRYARPGFVAALAALVALAGCGGGGGGAHGGAGLTGVGGLGLVDGGFGGFGLTDAGGSTGTDGPPLTPAPPVCGNGIVETGEACDVAAGCPAGQLCNATCGACAAAPAASMDSGDLIAAGLAAGRIDYFTSLLYRAYRLAGDGRLPTEFDGDLTVAEDASLFLEISRQWATLTPAQQSQLAPYIARPTDPTSVYSTAPTAAFDGTGDTGDQLFAAGDSDPIQCPVDPATQKGDWRYTEGIHFVVWSCGSGDPTTDPYAAKRAAAAALADQVWALETPSMGTPRPDDFVLGPADQTRIDIYLLPLNKCIRRGPNNVCAALTSPTLIAGTVPDSPCDASRGPLTSSGYILLRLDKVPDAAPAAAATKARSDFAHEFFHLLTYAQNMEVQGGACRNSKYTGPAGKGTWLAEASAVWAEWAYTPTDDPDYRGDLFGDYQKRAPASDSLLDNHLGAADNPSYNAFVYPLFLSQEAGGRAPLESLWKSASGARSAEALDDLLDARLPFDVHFRDFAVRMLNTTLPGDPVAPLLSTVDMAVPADYPPTTMAPEVMLPPIETDLPFHVTLAPLAAQYQLFSLPDITRWIDIDLTGAGADLTVDAIVNVRGTWERRKPVGSRLTLCRDDAKDDVSEMYVIIANTAHDAAAKADEDYKVKARVACPDSYTGWIRSESLVTSNYSVDNETVDDYERTSERWTLGAESTFNGAGVPLPAIDAYWSGNYERHDSLVQTLTGPCESDVVLQTTDGSGSGSHASRLVIGEFGNGGVTFSVTGDPLGMFNAPLTYYDETCDGMSQSMTSDNIVNEGLGVASVYLTLMPDASDPNHYGGMAVVAHQESPRLGGSDLVDWVVSWDITRHRKSGP